METSSTDQREQLATSLPIRACQRIAVWLNGFYSGELFRGVIYDHATTFRHQNTQRVTKLYYAIVEWELVLPSREQTRFRLECSP
jgi:hypothetical protein